MSLCLERDSLASVTKPRALTLPQRPGWHDAATGRDGTFLSNLVLFIAEDHHFSWNIFNAVCEIPFIHGYVYSRRANLVLFLQGILILLIG